MQNAETIATTETESRHGVALDYLERAQLISINDNDDCESATVLLVEVRKHAEALEDKRTEITKPINASLRALNALFKPPAEALEKARRMLEQKIVGYRDAVQRAAEEATRKAAELKAAGEHDAARAEIMTSPDAPVMAPQLSLRRVRRWRVQDIGKVPERYLVKSVDAALVGAAIDAVETFEQAKTIIPGIEVYEETQLPMRSK